MQRTNTGKIDCLDLDASYQRLEARQYAVLNASFKPTTSAKPIINKLQIDKKHADIFHITLKFSLFTVD